MATIKFIRVNPHEGFDSVATPRWQRIPEIGFRDVAVIVEPSTTDITIKSVTPAVVKMGTPPARKHRPGYHLCRLEPVGTGTGFVEASDAKGKLTARLQVSVKSTKSVTIKFFFVEDSHTENKKPTARPRTTPDVKTLITAITDIYVPQTNISFTSDGRLKRVRVDLGKDGDVDFRADDMVNKTFMTKSKDNAEWHAIAKHADPSPKILNVYFCPPLDDAGLREAAARDKAQGGSGEVRALWGHVGAAKKMKLGKDNRPNRNVCIFSDDVFTNGTPELVLAHEVGHYLGEAHVEEVDTDTTNHAHYEANYLMWGGGGPGGKHISRDQANVMNPSGT